MATDAEESGFLSRWARRKAQVREGTVVDDAQVAPAVAPVAAVRAPAAPAADPVATEPEPARPPAPTLADVATLNRDSDYRRFVASGVDPEVKNAALGKLFSDPHFNVMDGLDTYIDDYGKPDPLPAGMLRQMVQSQLLGLFNDEEEDPAAARQAAPLTPAKAAETSTDEDTALRLQSDDDAGHGGPAPGAGEDPGRQH